MPCATPKTTAWGAWLIDQYYCELLSVVKEEYEDIVKNEVQRATAPGDRRGRDDQNQFR